MNHFWKLVRLDLVVGVAITLVVLLILAMQE